MDITVVSVLKHSILLEASKKLGSQSALARYLNVSPSDMGEWINLKRCPNLKRWTDKELIEVNTKLFDLCGHTLEDIFPDDYRNAKAFLNAPKKFEARRQVEADAMLNYAQHTAQRLSYNANTNLIESDNFQHVLGPLLKRLSYRERTILELRYGLDKESEGTCHTLEEIGYILKVSKERVRQGEVKALRRIKGMALENNIVIEDFFDK